MDSEKMDFFVLAADGPAGRRFLAGPLALVSQLASAWRLPESGLAHRQLADAAALHANLTWSVLRAEAAVRLLPD